MGEQAVVYYQFKGLGHTFAEIEKNTKNVRVAKILSNQKKIGVIIVSFNTTSKQDKKTRHCEHLQTSSYICQWESRKPRSWVSWRNT